MHGIRRFKLDDDLSVYKQINAKCVFKQDVLIPKRNGFLPFDMMSSLAKFYSQKTLIDRFKQTWTKHLVNLHRCIQNISSYFVNLHASSVSALLCVSARFQTPYISPLRLCVSA